MSKLKFKTDLVIENISIFIDDSKVKETNNLASVELDISNEKHAVFIEKDGIKSNVLQLKKTDKEEITIKISKLLSIGKIIRIFIFLFLSAFSFHKAIGIGYYVFIIGGLSIGYFLYKKKDQLLLALK